MEGEGESQGRQRKHTKTPERRAGRRQAGEAGGRLGRLGEVWPEAGGPERGRAEGWRKATCARCAGAGLTAPCPLPHVHSCLLSSCSCRRPHSLGAPPLSPGLRPGAAGAPARPLLPRSALPGSLPRCVPHPRPHSLSPWTLESQTSLLGASNDPQEAFDRLPSLLQTASTPQLLLTL